MFDDKNNPDKAALSFSKILTGYKSDTYPLLDCVSVQHLESQPFHLNIPKK